VYCYRPGTCNSLCITFKKIIFIQTNSLIIFTCPNPVLLVTATNATFISLNGAQLYSPYVGDSERLIGEVSNLFLAIFQNNFSICPSY
jgi:hypothetical protein